MRSTMAWLTTAVSLSFAIMAVLAYGLAYPEATLLGPAIVRGPQSAPGAREVALTFDDGPSQYTPQILDELRATGVRATFFLCGENAERYPDVVRRIRDEGHVIGNHTFSHPYLYLMERRRIVSEIDRTQEILERLTGRRPTLFRPPFGVRWFSLRRILEERGLQMAMWTVRAYDGRYAPERIAQVALGGLRPGAIILLHDGFEAKTPDLVDRSNTVKALPAIIAGARKAGYTFVALK